MHVSGVEVVSMCLDAAVCGCASATPAAVGPMRFSLSSCCLLLHWYGSLHSALLQFYMHVLAL